MGFGNRLKTQIKANGYTMEAVGNLMGVSKGAISHWCNDIRSPSTDDIRMLSKILNVDASVFFSDKKESVMKIRVISEASCGLPISDIEIKEEVYVNKDNYNNRMYAVRAVGDSMTPEVSDGDRVVCDPSIEIYSGDLVHYRIHNENAIKVYVEDKDMGIVQFVPFNSSDVFKTTSFKIDDIEDIEISKVVDIISNKRNNRASRLKSIGR